MPWILVPFGVKTGRFCILAVYQNHWLMNRPIPALWLTAALLVPLQAFKSPESEAYVLGEAVVYAYPKDYFVRPIGDVLKLSGTFGELRNNHFHSGIDIKSSTGGVGQPVYAAADGYIDRIKVEESGYGNALYIRHPNGYTTVYAHLDRFNADVEAFVRDRQYADERFSVDLLPATGKFAVKAGQEIGKLGNSGSSSGPHLHFEIRNTASGLALNPLLFGLAVADDIPPEVRDMKVYFLREDRSVLHSKSFPVRRLGHGRYGITGDTAYIGAWRVGFGVKTYDQLNGLSNENGVYSIDMFVDGKQVYGWKTEDLSFKETRYLNAHVDYEAKKRQGGWFNRLFLLPGNRLSGYRPTETSGAVPLFKDRPQEVLINILDASGNASEVRFWVRRSADMEVVPAVSYNQELAWNAENMVRYDGFNVRIPKDILYEDVYFRYSTTADKSADVYSPVHHVHEETTPVHGYFDLAIRPLDLPQGLFSKAVVVNCGTQRPVNCGGELRNDGFIHTKVREFGDYCVMIDNTPPKITPIQFAHDMRGKRSLEFKITDNFGTTAQAKGLRYKGTIDGRWVLFSFDAKRDRLTHVFDARTGPGEHVLRLEVTDDRKNKAVFERTFTR